MVWGASIAWYLFLAGLGAGAYATSVLVARKYPSDDAFRRAGRVIAPVAVAIGLVLLMIDAEAGFKNPLRFFYLITNFNSVMTWGVVILSAFMAVSVATLVLDFLGKSAPLALECCGLVLALATAAYTGVLLGVVQTFPLWNSPLLPVLFVVSAASTGSASVVLAGCFVGANREKQVQLLERTRLVLPCIELALIALLLVTTQGNVAGIASVASITGGSYAPLFWIGLVLVGLLLPIGVSCYGLRHNSSPIARTAVAETCVLAGGFILRFLIVIAALPIS